jgi:hypothetical protein
MKIKSATGTNDQVRPDQIKNSANQKPQAGASDQLIRLLSADTERRLRNYISVVIRDT